MQINYEYPKTTNVVRWERYLNRRLNVKEHHLLEEVKSEARMNKKIDMIYEKCIDQKLYIPALTELVGNCLFESLNYHEIGSSVINLRQGLSYIMFQFKDFPNFFPGQESTLCELFTCFNDIEYVFCKEDGKLYKYNYDIMCQDLADDMSWAKLPTQLILMVISYFFGVKIEIINNETSWVNTINVNLDDQESLKTIRIGHILESHYIPLDVLNDDEEHKKLYYLDAKRKFIRWGKRTEVNKLQLIQKKMATRSRNRNINNYVEMNGINEDDAIDY